MIMAGQLAQLLAGMPAYSQVVLDGSGTLSDWRGEVRDGRNVLVLYAREPAQWQPTNDGAL